MFNGEKGMEGIKDRKNGVKDEDAKENVSR
jgi:hypothetical protein